MISINLRRCSIDIPKRIVQTGKDVRQDLRNRAAMANIRLLNPDYEYCFFDDAQVEAFIDNEFPQYRAVVNSFLFPIQRFDFFRYLVILRYGGFYFDLDVLLASSLSPLLGHRCVFPFEALTVSHFLRTTLKMDWQVGNYAFGATPGHPFIEAIITNCVKACVDPAWVKPMMRGTPPLIKNEFFVINSTGPGLVSRTLAENRGLASTVTVLFPDDVCDRRTWHRFGEYGVHLGESSWRSKRSIVAQKATDYCWRCMTNWRLRQSRKLGKSRCNACEVA